MLIESKVDVDAPERQRILAMMDIDRLTRLGSEEVKHNRLEHAVEYFQNAYNLSRNLSDEVTERACAFNLGAAYVRVEQPVKGLEYLQRAVPPMNRRDGASNGDLFHNFALAYEKLDNKKEMINFFQQALEEYRREHMDQDLEIAISVKLAKALYDGQQYDKSAEVYRRLVDLYEKCGDHNGMAEAMLKCSKHLARIGGDEHTEWLNKCVRISEMVSDVSIKCKLLEELGLTYIQRKEYEKATECFEKELSLVQNNEIYKERQAITLQNLGALHNSKGQYDKSITYHESAARLFGEIGKRRNQGHCFMNLAFAHARMNDSESAGECYLHALLAARDTRDKKAEWQAAEGLAAVAFIRGQTDKAILYYKQALGALSGVEGEAQSQERIVAKLTDALQAKVSSDQPRATPLWETPRPVVPTPPVPVNEPVRVDTAQPESEQIVASRADELNWAQASTSQAEPESSRKDVSVRVNNVQRNISHEIQKPSGPLKRRKGSADAPHSKYKFSLGIGEYESDSDRSLSDEGRRSSAEQDKLSEEMNGMLQNYRNQKSDYSKKRPGTARNDRRSKNAGEQASATSETESEGESESSDDGGAGERRRGQNRSMTATTAADSWESDQEWKHQAAKFLVTGSATNSATTVTDESTHKTEDVKEHRAISKNLERRPIGSNKLSTTSSDSPILDRGESIPDALQPDDSPSRQSRHVSAVMKLRGSFVEASESETNEPVYAEIEPKKSPEKSTDKLEGTYEAPGNFFESDKNTEFVENSTVTSSTSGEESSTEYENDEEKENTYESLPMEEPLASTSQTVFPSPKHDRDLGYTGPMESPPPPPINEATRPTVTPGERDDFMESYRQKLEQLNSEDSGRVDDVDDLLEPRRRQKKSAFCMIM